MDSIYALQRGTDSVYVPQQESERVYRAQIARDNAVQINGDVHVHHVAGFATLSDELGHSSRRLRLIKNSYSGSSEQLGNLTFEMQTHGLMLRQMEIGRQASVWELADLDVLDHCIQIYRVSINRITELTEELESEPSAGADDADSKALRISEGLEQARRSLTLAYQMYLQTQQQRSLERNTKLVKCSTGEVPKGDPDVDHGTFLDTSQMVHRDSAARRARNQKQRRVHRSTTRWSFRLQPWLISRIWDISIVSSNGQWNLVLNTLNLVPSDAEVFDACRKGDLDRLRKMINAGIASPFDRTYYYGAMHSPLTAALEEKQFEVCRYLLELGALQEDMHDSLGSYCALFYNDIDDESDKFFKLFIQDFNLDVDDVLADATSRPTWWSFIPPSCIPVVIGALSLSYRGESADTRFRTAFSLVDPDILCRMTIIGFLHAAGLDTMSGELATYTSPLGLSAAHFLAYCLLNDRVPYEQICVQMKHLVAGGVDLNLPTQYYTYAGFGRTPLLFLLTSGRRSWSIQALLEKWIRALKCADVDIVQYGRREQAFWESLGSEPLEIFGFGKLRCGPRVEDWDVHVRRQLWAKRWVLESLPGSWEGLDPMIPAIQFAQPSNSEEALGNWTHTERLVYSRSRLSDEYWEVSRSASIRDLIEKAQDDAGILPLLLSRYSTKSKAHAISRTRRRSSPDLRHLDRHGQHYLTGDSHQWLGAYHICNLCPARLIDSDQWPKWPTDSVECIRLQPIQSTWFKRIHNQMVFFVEQFPTRSSRNNLSYEDYRPFEPL